ncbi:MAG TPA: MBL fold metallo-hydrolase [Gammaproteobacteria bacterium]|nr:MBL fold metallo-hydrolase [Gammaproteobacteria bacterium]
MQAGLAGAAALAAPLRHAFAQSSVPALGTTRLGDGIAVISGGGANVTAFGNRDAALLVDTGLADRIDDVIAAALAVTGASKVAIAFNTNWRPEHSGGNERLHAAGATIMAHENTKLWIGADFDVDWEHLKHRPRPPEALPDKTFYTNGDVEVAGRKVEYGYLPQASTDGDIYVFFPDANVLAVSDLLAVGGYPLVDYATGGWIGGLEKATQKLLEIANDETRIVPADGPVQRRPALEAQLELCTAVREAVRDAYKGGHSFEEFLAAKPTAPFDAERGDPELFLRLVYKGAWGHVRELGGGII